MKLFQRNAAPVRAQDAPLIAVHQVSKIYNEGKDNEVRALDNVSFTIHDGEFVAIVGQSGSGKSTLMNILGCLDIPTYGSYDLDGYAVSQMKPSTLSDIRNREIGFIFQGFHLIPSLSAVENVELPLIYRGLSAGERRKLSLDALERVGLSNRGNHLPSEMSGGQQQRVAIARAIAAAPPIIMADEPTGALDSNTSREVLGFLQALNRQGHTILLITHDNDIAKQARRVIRITDGRIVFDG